jgi:hypothetical protein
MALYGLRGELKLSDDTDMKFRNGEEKEEHEHTGMVRYFR